jgi:hypothetical protein
MRDIQLTIFISSADLDRLHNIVRPRGQSVSEYVAQLISSDLADASAPAAVTYAVMPTARDRENINRFIAACHRVASQ